MKKTIILLTVAALALPLTAKPGKPGLRKGDKTEDLAERMALREEERVHVRGDHTLIDLKANPETKDMRSDDIGAYTQHTIHRIVKLNAMGALEEDDATALKDEHSRIVKTAKDAAADGEVTAEERAAYRAELDQLNDDINARFQGVEAADKSTPLVNRTQLRFEEKIEAGEASGRLSKGEASRLRRDLEGLERLEDRLKDGELSTRDREKLMEEVLEVRKEIMDSLLD